jgi:hypothetical protein
MATLRYPTIDRGYTRYGASMGRAEWGRKEEPADRSVRVFRLPIDSQGYDPGGAYWGIGEPLYCATDGETYRRFVRAQSRDQAIAKLGLSPTKLKVPGKRTARDDEE